ncbi:hypothetical protein EMIT0P176_10136 [Pseudomonas sp. IT-P176]
MKILIIFLENALNTLNFVAFEPISNSAYI